MKKGGVKTLFEGVFEAISDFSNEYEKYGAELIYFKREMISALRKKSLGKKGSCGRIFRRDGSLPALPSGIIFNRK